MTIDDQIEKIIEIFSGFTAHVEPYHIEELREEIRKVLTPPSLSDYDLVIGQEVKFVPPNQTNKRTGRVKGMNADGSIYIQDSKKAFGRSIHVGDLYVEVAGPRGGTILKKVGE